MSDREKALEAALLPCPFCGGEAYFIRKGDRRMSTVVGCTVCGCSLENGEEWDHGRGWNTRTALAMPATVNGADFLRGREAGRDAAAAECDRLRESYRRSLSLYDESDPQYRVVKYSGAAVAVCAENIRRLTLPEDAP